MTLIAQLCITFKEQTITMPIENINPQHTLTLACACIQAYRAYDGKPVVAPSGYKLKGNWSAVDSLSDDKTERIFGLVFEAENDSKDVIFAFRGTRSWRDWAGNFRFPLTQFEPFDASQDAVPNDVQVSTGFQARYKDMRQSIFNWLDELQPNTVSLTGHSLGGALSTLFYLDVALSRPNYNPTHYTFASPRVGNPTFVDFYNSQVANPTIRVSNYEDYVPCVPPEWVGYKHVSEWYPLCFTGEGLFAWHSMDNYYRALCHKFGVACDCQLHTDPPGRIAYCEPRAECSLRWWRNLSAEEKAELAGLEKLMDEA
jgi:triacylglycerol lipase